jgi:hypothetical protein
MASPRQLILDQWAGLSFKRGVRRLESTGGHRNWMAPSWVGEANERRLAAYKVLYAIFRNVGREFLNTDDDDVRAQHREYGDANLLVKVVLAAVMGDDLTLSVEGADDEANTAAVDRQTWFEDWATTERLRAKVMETERDAQKLGDGVYVLGISPTKKRVRLRLYDPGFYFPELDPNAAEDEFPTRVHIAWEFEAKDGTGRTVRRVRRITWELVPLPEGQTRRYPWNDEASSTTCYMTDGTWALDELDGFDVERFPLSRATFGLQDTAAGPVAIDHLDLGIDFLPVLHLPNTVEIKEHFGEALVTAVAQILEDLARADTDTAAAAQLAGVPMVGYSGSMGATNISVRPGTVLGLGPGGTMSPLDLSAGLRACMEYVTSLRDRLNENVRVPAEVVGRVEANTERSGIHLALSFGPMRSLIEEMRLVRDEKYPLLLKFVQRLSIAAGFLEGDVMPAELKFGSFLPTDRSAAVDLVVKLWEKRLISRSTAIATLVDEGIIDVDVAEELEQAQADDFDAALALLDATDDVAAVFEFLNRTAPAPRPTPALNPVIPLPPVPGRNAPPAQPPPTGPQPPPVP